MLTTKKLNDIDKIMVMTASGTQPIEIFDKYSISFIYSMLSMTPQERAKRQNLKNDS